ncbi:MAG TPA: hypothetical protein VNQ77_15190 [Frankiaceae bacterium]|nr:hypothetical protein [Frankiaceae bacterium]
MSDTGLVEVTGIDGAGKSTVVAELARALGWSARKVQPFSPEVMARVDAARTAFGERGADVARSLALGSELLRHADAGVPPAVYDRYVESAKMWWHVKDLYPLPDDVVARLPAPSLVLLLDVDPETALARRLTTTEVSSEAETTFIEACTRYLRAAAVAHDWVVVDAARPLDEVVTVATAAVRAHLGSRSPR